MATVGKYKKNADGKYSKMGGKYLRVATTTDTDCCCATLYCIQEINATATCADDGYTDWTLTETLYESYAFPMTDGWYELTPGVLCGPKRKYVVYGSRLAGAPCPTAPALPAPPEREVCRVCFNVLVELAQLTESWINETKCPDVPYADAQTTKVVFDLCGTRDTDWLEGSVWWVSGTLDHTPVRYQHSTGTLQILAGINNAGWETVSTAGCTTGWQQYAAGGSCWMTISATPTDFEWIGEQYPAPAVGEYSTCIGRNLVATDAIHEQLTRTYTVTATPISCEPDKWCYYTKTSTCTLVNPTPPVYAWLPGTVTAQCLAADPGTLDTWTLVSGTTYQIIRKGDACDDSSACTAGLAPETPTGILPCP